MMIDWNADHIGFVVMSYGIVAIVLVALVAVTLRRAATLRKALSEMNLSDPGRQQGN